MKARLLRALTAARAARRPVGLVTDLKTGQQTLVGFDRDDPGRGPAAAVTGDFGLTDDDRRQIAPVLASGRAAIVTPGPDREWFVELFAAPLRLLVVGAVHITQGLVPMAHTLGYAVTVIDPRGAFATPERLPGVAVVDDWPDAALTAAAPDHRTAVVTLTHDPKLDDPALMVALGSPAFYVGALGSRRTHAKRVERLVAAGVPEAALARLHAPVGLDIGAATPAEIALAILAQITAVLHGRPAPGKGAG